MAEKLIKNYKKWWQKKLTNKQRNTIIHTTMILGFVIANILAFHNIMEEKRELVKDYNNSVNALDEYIKTHRIIETEKEKCENIVRQQLRQFIADSIFLMQADTIWSEDKKGLSEEEKQKINDKEQENWVLTTGQWLQDHLGMEAYAEFNNYIKPKDYNFTPMKKGITPEQLQSIGYMTIYRDNLEQLKEFKFGDIKSCPEEVISHFKKPVSKGK